MFIAIRAPIWGLLVTVTFVIVELCALWATKTLSLGLETRILRQKLTVRLRNHCLRQRIIAALLVVSFLGLETLSSTFTDTAFLDTESLQECLQLVPLSQNSTPNVFHDSRSEIILFRCLNFDGAVLEQSLGRVSLETFNVTCNERSLYSYNNSLLVQRSTSTAQMRCGNFSFFNLDGTEYQDERCVFLELEGDVLFLSGAPRLRPLQPVEEDEFLATRIHRDFIPLLPTVVDRYLHFQAIDQETEELYARGVMFTDLIQTRCLFPTGRIEGVTVPNSILVTVSAIWILAVLSALFARVMTWKKSLMNLSDPFFWISDKFGQGKVPKKHVRVDEHGGVLVSEPSVQGS